ncbi:hypothetical protein BCV70DRAFT_123125 [Testicularia cyperi]|uniref:Uncharacterized protein n=1 Tax=Testicularia cyperi TaxID=1882483 RepID=A0A317XL54_9BASI|nr:hypothetical protein BCV70DRAFT_123125 [Testicularia cyperi]
MCPSLTLDEEGAPDNGEAGRRQLFDLENNLVNQNKSRCPDSNLACCMLQRPLQTRPRVGLATIVVVRCDWSKGYFRRVEPHIRVQSRRRIRPGELRGTLLAWRQGMKTQVGLLVQQRRLSTSVVGSTIGAPWSTGGATKSQTTHTHVLHRLLVRPISSN